MLRVEFDMPVYIVFESSELENLLTVIDLPQEGSAATTDKVQFILNSKQANAMRAKSFVTLQGLLHGKNVVDEDSVQEGGVIAIVSHYDTFGVVPVKFGQKKKIDQEYFF